MQADNLSISSLHFLLLWKQTVKTFQVVILKPHDKKARAHDERGLP